MTSSCYLSPILSVHVFRIFPLIRQNNHQKKKDTHYFSFKVLPSESQKTRNAADSRYVSDGDSICVRPHQSLNGKTPAQAARMEVPSNWKGLIDEATKHEATLLVNVTKPKQEEQELKVVSK